MLAFSSKGTTNAHVVTILAGSFQVLMHEHSRLSFLKNLAVLYVGYLQEVPAKAVSDGVGTKASSM